MKSKNLHIETLKTRAGIDAYHVGPPLNEGPLPTLIYFALSGEESLTLDPFNQPIVFLKEQPIRKISFTLPYHGGAYAATETISLWAKDLVSGRDFVSPFIDNVIAALDELINDGYIDSNHIAAAGLSRGGFMACHLAAKDKRISTILGFAPLTQFSLMTEFHATATPALAESLSLMEIIDLLVGKKLRFYIGNRDTRVGTPQCFEFINALVETSFKNKLRSPPVELIISPSIGHKGHGTGPEIFKEGADWITKALLS